MKLLTTGVEMQKRNFIIYSILLVSLALFGFDCSSTEITSAKLYIQQKQYDKALEALRKEVKTNPKSDEGYYMLGVVYGEKEMYDDMRGAFDSSLAISKKYAKEIDQEKKFYWANLFNQAVKYYNEGMKAGPDSMKIILNKSAHDFNEGVKLEPDSAQNYKNLAFVYMNLGENDKAIEPLQTLIKKDHSVDNYKLLGQLLDNKAAGLMNKYKDSKDVQDSLQAMSTYNQAIDVLQKGRQLYPNDTNLLLYISNAYIGTDRMDQARDAFKEGIQKDSTNKYYRYDYGVILLNSNEYPAAITQFKKAVELDPNYQNAIYNLGIAYVKWGTEINSETLKKDSASTDTTYKLKYQQALPYLEKLVQLKTDDASAWELLGKVYAVLGMKDDAANAFNKADAIRKKQ